MSEVSKSAKGGSRHGAVPACLFPLFSALDTMVYFSTNWRSSIRFANGKMTPACPVCSYLLITSYSINSIRQCSCSRKFFWFERETLGCIEDRILILALHLFFSVPFEVLLHCVILEVNIKSQCAFWLVSLR